MQALNGLQLTGPSALRTLRHTRVEQPQMRHSARSVYPGRHVPSPRQALQVLVRSPDNKLAELLPFIAVERVSGDRFGRVRAFREDQRPALDRSVSRRRMKLQEHGGGIACSLRDLARTRLLGHTQQQADQ